MFSKKVSIDHQTFTLLVKEHSQKLYYVVRRMVANHDDANDLVQEAFTKAWEKRKQFKGDSEPYTWLYSIATNLCLEFLRKKKVRQHLSISNYDEHLAKQLTAPSVFNGNESQRLLYSALFTLPEKQRLVFVLKYFDDLKYSDIARITSTSEGALKASYNLANKKIEDFIQKQLNLLGTNTSN